MAASWVVADAGPLIHLDELGVLPLLAQFAPVQVPDAVWQELEQHRPAALQAATMANPALLLRVAAPAIPPNLQALMAFFTLHLGELQALALCQQAPSGTSPMLLTDDTAARLAAQSLHIAAHGSLGVLLRGLRGGQLDKPSCLALLHSLPQRSSLHIKPAFLAEVLRQVQAWPGV